MNGANDRSLQERVDRLETTVAEMHNVLGQLRGSGIRPNPSARRAAGKPISPPTPSQNVIPQRPSSTVVGNSESWLKIVGIGLLLFGVGFLFKFSVEQGWLTERVRIGFGLALGTGLLVTGIRLQADRRPFSQVLLGGGVATYYITGFAAYQLYALLAHPVAFAFMGAVTLFAFFLALRQQAAILSVVGAVGGLGTPFLLYTDAGTVPGLVGYTCLVLGGATAIYLYRGWRSLLWTSFVGGWAVFLVGIHEGDLSDPDRGALQAGLLFAWMVFWAVPVIRGVLTGRNPARWAVPALGVGPVAIRKLAIGHTHLLSAPGPLLALGSTGLVWSLSAEQTGWLAAGGALASPQLAR